MVLKTLEFTNHIEYTKRKIFLQSKGKSDSDSICTVASYIFHGTRDKAQIKTDVSLSGQR